MIIFCNRPGGFKLFGVRLTKGENIVDDDIWARVRNKLDAKLYTGLTEPTGDAPAILELRDDTGLAPLAGDEAKAEIIDELRAKDKIAMIDACEISDDLYQHAKGETRKTVLLAIERRMRVLIEHEHVPGFEGV